MSAIKKKLIEVALPLEAINRESAREKSIRHGHPATLHIWWARRPLAACRAILFAQLVDDPSAHPEKFPTEEEQKIERKRLFEMIEKLVTWENIADKQLLEAANAEILASLNGQIPKVLDPFAGGGSIPLEAQRLGLAPFASDLNPIAVLINKALIEIPAKWYGMPPVFIDPNKNSAAGWSGSTGIAEDVYMYGQFIKDQAIAKLEKNYPSSTLPDGTTVNTLAWLWARTVKCQNPACGIQMPLLKSFWLSKKPKRPRWLLPTLENGQVRFKIQTDGAPSVDGTITRAGAKCVGCGGSLSLAQIKEAGMNGTMGAQMTVVVAEGNRQRVYLEPTQEQLSAADVASPLDVPELELSTHPQYMGTPRYGLTNTKHLFTNRQLLTIKTFTELVKSVKEKILNDALSTGMEIGGTLEEGGTGAQAYADSITTYLAFSVSKLIDRSSALSVWDSTPSNETVRGVFGRQSISMAWDFAEGNPMGKSTGGFDKVIMPVVDALKRLPSGIPGNVIQADAVTRDYSPGFVISTDPPYYDNVPYSDLSDFFYVWLRDELIEIWPRLLSTVSAPKSEELVADSVRLGSKQKAQDYFEDGFRNVFLNIRQYANPDIPMTVYYAFKQTDNSDSGEVSTGWQTLLEGMLSSGWKVTATWPVRTELANRMRSVGSNALASSIVLALRLRPEDAPTVSRRNFVNALKSHMPSAMKQLQEGNIAPVDLAQAAIGPGMAIFSNYAKVLEADGSSMTVKTALAIINQILDEVLNEQESDFDADTRFCVKWYSQFGWNEGQFGEAESLAKAVNTSISALERSGVFRSIAGKARLVRPEEMSINWDPKQDKHISVWEVSLRISYALKETGIDAAASWMDEAAHRVDIGAVKELSYLLFSISGKKGWTDSAILFNGLGTAWSDIQSVSSKASIPSGKQDQLDFTSPKSEE
jgi:putative DNA methylase